MYDLREIWSTKMLLADTDGDGIPDDTRFSFDGITNRCCPSGLVDFSARAGLETCGISLSGLWGEKPESGTKHENWNVTVGIEEVPYARCRLMPHCRTISFTAGSADGLNRILRWMAGSWPHALPALSAKGAEIEQVEYHDGQFRFKDADGKMSNWIISDKQNPDSPAPYSPTFHSLSDLWTTAGFYQAGRTGLNDRCSVKFEFERQIAPDTLKKACCLAARIGLSATGMSFPLTGETPERELVFEVDAQESEAPAQVSWHLRSQSKTVEIRISGGKKAVGNALQYFAKAKTYEEGGTFGIWEKETQASGEEPLLLEKHWHDQGEHNRLMQEISTWAKEIAPCGSVHVTAFVSEPLETRTDIKDQIINCLRRKAKNITVDVHSAFKPGYHWIEEELIPKLTPISSQIGRIVFHCREEREEGCLELPIRWIQELYPADRLLEQKIGIDADAVEFELKPDQKPTYSVKVFSKENTTLLQADFTVPVVPIDYINSGRKSYPTTGFLRMDMDGQLYREKLMPTDREAFWDFFGKEVVSGLADLLPVREKGRGYRYPLFNRMTVEARMSEEERKLGIGEERISSLEALHEDIYFDVLDFFHYLGKKLNGKPMTTIGGIHPYMTVAPGEEPSACVKIYGWNPPLEQKAETLSLQFCPDSPEPESCDLLRRGHRESIPSLQWILPKTFSVENLNCPDAHVWLGGISYEGRDIPVIDLYSAAEAEFVSPHKLSSFKPTILIEAGHHANEVSSMPAIIGLINRLDRSFLKRVNLVVIPFANPDGRALHQDFAKENPEWKLHAARFNSVGLEYARQRFRDTFFGEARVLPNAFWRWLPDIVDDDHGIPSHEWVQPFAGYNSAPTFPVSYWIPNSMIYGISKDLTTEGGRDRKKFADRAIDRIVSRISEDPEIAKLNQSYAQIFYKYGARWLPDLFPIHQSKGMIFHHWDTEPDQDSHEVIARFPEWCSMELISETADETVNGKALELCVRAHQLFDLAFIEETAQSCVHRSFVRDGDRIGYIRKRPLQ